MGVRPAPTLHGWFLVDMARCRSGAEAPGMVAGWLQVVFKPATS